MEIKQQLDFSCAEWIETYRNAFPALWEMILHHTDEVSFEHALEKQIREKLSGSLLTEFQQQAAECLLNLIHQSEIPCLECSEEELISCRTLRQLWHGVHDDPRLNAPDFYLDLYRLFAQLEGMTLYDEPHPSLTDSMSRWPSGLDPEIRQLRRRNKERIIGFLVQDITNCGYYKNSRYSFQPGMSEKTKYDLVHEWWNDYRFHLSMAIRSADSLDRYLGYTLSDEVMQRLRIAERKGIPFFITPYYISLLNTEKDGFDDLTIRDYVIYSQELVDSFGSIKAWEREDNIETGRGNAAGWLLPNQHSVHRRYPDVAILIPDTMGRACGGLCASCQRMYGFQKGNLNFDLEQLKPKKGWLGNLSNTLSYFENDSQLRDILITGGDALMSQNKTLRILLDEILKMVVRKRETNFYRPAGKKFAELQRIRLGTRLPVYLPFRINDELVEILTEFRKRGEMAGIRQFVIQTHFQSPLEMTPEALDGIRKLLSAGWVVTNQLVFTVPASRRGHTAKLRRILNENGILCYYTFTVKGFEENKALFAPNNRSVQEQREEKAFGLMTEPAVQELIKLLDEPALLPQTLPGLLDSYNLPFMATDRNVMNLPGIGKSMTFRLAGIDPQGRRILAFSHDATRRHSPVIEHMPDIYIRERKSIGAYMRQLREMGEDIGHYQSLWSVREGETEKRFPMYEYPQQPHQVTEEVTNLA